MTLMRFRGKALGPLVGGYLTKDVPKLEIPHQRFQTILLNRKLYQLQAQQAHSTEAQT